MSSSPSSSNVDFPSVTPGPTDEEFVAILAALELAWPRPVVMVPAHGAAKQVGDWKWSGRWWSQPRR